jgi:hypothetical protein
MEDGAAAVDPKVKGAATTMEDGDKGQWRMEESLPPSIWRRELPLLSRKEEVVPSRPRVRRPRFRHPHIIAGELYSQRQATSRRHRQ